ncbi:MAG: hypothetical protein F6K19_31710 [Cyanothece sp. SIO1E1]|nr:hypothetical protein [Cyanothece sp. SIO1E1]
MNKNMNQTLLALLLALNDLETSLTEQDQRCFAEVAEQLNANPKAWEAIIAPRLLASIESNSQLKSTFQLYKTRLETIKGNLPHNLLPQESELSEAAPVKPGLVAKGFKPKNTAIDMDSDEINNIAFRVLSTSRPEETVKKLGSFGQLKDFLKQSLG